MAILRPTRRETIILLATVALATGWCVDHRRLAVLNWHLEGRVQSIESTLLNEGRPQDGPGCYLQRGPRAEKRLDQEGF